jgi:hypothetical protein
VRYPRRTTRSISARFVPNCPKVCFIRHPFTPGRTPFSALPSGCPFLVHPVPTWNSGIVTLAPVTPRTPGFGPAVFSLSRTVASIGHSNIRSRMLKQWIKQPAQAGKLPFRSWPAPVADRLVHRRKIVCARELHAYTEHRHGPTGAFRRLTHEMSRGERCPGWRRTGDS